MRLPVLSILMFLFFFAFVEGGFAQGKKQATLVSELKALYEVAELPVYRTNSISAQVSTYDTTGGNNDGFDGNYSFIRRGNDSSLVIFDVKGAGVINRMWTPTPTEDTLDFYIDDTLTPALSICYMDLFSGKVYPFMQPLSGNQLGGYYTYFPVLFQNSCRIVCRGKAMQFHQLQYRLYEAGTVVKPFSKLLSTEEKTAMGKIDKLWNSVAGNLPFSTGGNDAAKTIASSVNIAPGQTKPLFSLGKGGRITGIELGPAYVFEGVYKNIDIRVFWDDEKLPAIDCPVADFFGYAFGKASMSSLLSGTAGNTNYCFLPMPFDKAARIELVYRAAKDTALPPVQVTCKVYYTLQQRAPATEGKMYARWQQSNTIAKQPHTFLNVNGKGHYVGTILQAQGFQPHTIFFEGDDSTVIDGQLRLHGTGSEDYFNGGWYALLDRWDGRMSLPLHGALDYSLTFSHTGGYRFYLSDKLSFEKSFHHSIEHGPEGNNIPALYTSVAFYYSNMPVEDFVKPSDENTKVYIPDTLNLYPQFSKVEIGNDVELLSSWQNNTVGQSFELVVNEDSKLRISLQEIPAGKYKVFINYTEQPEGSSFSVWQRQTQLSSWINSNAVEKKPLKNKHIADISITALNNTITFKFKPTEINKKFAYSKLMLVKAL